MSVRRSLIPAIILASMALGAILVAGMMGVRYSDVQRTIRIALGLPKFWVTSFNDDVTRYRPVACPAPGALVIVTGGQSNAANHYEHAPPADANSNTFMFYGGKCYKLQSPVLGATGEDDSLWPALGDKLNVATGRPVVFINGAVGGTQLGDWLDARSRYLERLVGQIRQARQAGFKPDFVVWIEGETDAAIELAPDVYAHEQRALIDKLDDLGATDSRTRWVLYRSTHCSKRTGNGPAIEHAIAELARQEGDRIVLGPNVTGYDDSFRRDGCHLNTRGRDRLVDESLPILINNQPMQP